MSAPQENAPKDEAAPASPPTPPPPTPPPAPPSIHPLDELPDGEPLAHPVAVNASASTAAGTTVSGRSSKNLSGVAPALFAAPPPPPETPKPPPSRWRRVWFWGKIGMAVLVGLPLLFALLVFLYVKLGFLDSAVKSALKERFGPESRYSALDTSLTTVQVDELELPGADGQGPLLKVKKIKMKWDVWRLLNDNRLRSVRLESPEVFLRRGTDGEWNLKLKPTPPSRYTIEQIFTEDGKFTLEWSSTRRFTLTDLDISQRAKEGETPGALVLKGQLPSEGQIQADFVIGPGTGFSGSVSGHVDFEKDLSALEIEGLKGRAGVDFKLRRAGATGAKFDTADLGSLRGVVQLESLHLPLPGGKALETDKLDLDCSADVRIPTDGSPPKLEQFGISAKDLFSLELGLDKASPATGAFHIDKGTVSVKLENLNKLVQPPLLPPNATLQGDLICSEISLGLSPMGVFSGSGKFQLVGGHLTYTGLGELPALSVSGGFAFDGPLSLTIQDFTLDVPTMLRFQGGLNLQPRADEPLWFSVLYGLNPQLVDLNFERILSLKGLHDLFAGPRGEMRFEGSGRLTGRQDLKVEAKVEGAKRKVVLKGLNIQDLIFKHLPIPFATDGVKISGPVTVQAAIGQTPELEISADLYGPPRPFLAKDILQTQGQLMAKGVVLHAEQNPTGGWTQRRLQIADLTIPVVDLKALLGFGPMKGERLKPDQHVKVEGLSDDAVFVSNGPGENECTVLVGDEKHTVKLAQVKVADEDEPLKGLIEVTKLNYDLTTGELTANVALVGTKFMYNGLVSVISADGTAKISYKNGILSASGRMKNFSGVAVYLPVSSFDFEITLDLHDSARRGFRMSAVASTGQTFSLTGVVAADPAGHCVVNGDFDSTLVGGMKGQYSFGVDPERENFGPLKLSIQKLTEQALKELPAFLNLQDSWEFGGGLEGLTLELDEHSYQGGQYFNSLKGRFGLKLVGGKVRHYSPQAVNLDGDLQAENLNGDFHANFEGLLEVKPRLGTLSDLSLVPRMLDMVLDLKQAEALFSLSSERRYYLPILKNRRILARAVLMPWGIGATRIDKLSLSVQGLLEFDAKGSLQEPKTGNWLSDGEWALTDMSLRLPDLAALHKEVLAVNLKESAPEWAQAKIGGSLTLNGKYYFAPEHQAFNGDLNFKEAELEILRPRTFRFQGLNGALPLKFYTGIWPAEWGDAKNESQQALIFRRMDCPPFSATAQVLDLRASPNLVRSVGGPILSIPGGRAVLHDFELRNLLGAQPGLAFGLNIERLDVAELAKQEGVALPGLSAKDGEGLMKGNLNKISFVRALGGNSGWNLTTEGEVSGQVYGGTLSISQFTGRGLFSSSLVWGCLPAPAGLNRERVREDKGRLSETRPLLAAFLDALLEERAFSSLGIATGPVQAETGETNFERSNPAIQKILESQATHAKELRAYKDRGAIGESADGLIELRAQNSLPLEEKRRASELVAAERQDRAGLFREWALTNGFGESESARVARDYAKRQRKLATPTDWIQIQGPNQPVEWVQKKALKE